MTRNATLCIAVALLLLLLPNSYAALTDGLYENWNLTTLNGSRGYLNFTQTAGCTNATGKGIIGDAWNCAGSGWLTTTATPVNDTTYAITFWMNRSTSDGNQDTLFVRDGTGFGQDYIALYPTNGTIEMNTGGGSGPGNQMAHGNCTSTSLANAWAFIYAEWNRENGNMTLELNDGACRLTKAVTYGGSRTSTVYFGGKIWGNSNYFFDEINIYNRSLNASERTALYNNGTGFAYPFSNPITGNNLSVSVNDTRTGSSVSGFNFNVTNGTEEWSGYCAGASCTNGTMNVTNAYLYVWNVSGGTYFNASTGPFNFSNETALSVAAQTYRNSVTMNLTNSVNGTGITSFCGMASTGGSGCTTNGTMTLFGMEGDTTLTWYNVSGGTYFNATKALLSYNSSASNHSANTSQAYLNVTASQAFTGTAITVFNATNGLAKNSTPGGDSVLLPANNGTNNVLVQVAGNYSQNVTCNVTDLFTTVQCAATGFFDDKFNITARNSTGSVVTNFSVTANASIGSTSLNSTANATIFSLLQGYSWTFSIDAPGYALTNVTLPANASTNAYTFNLSPTNSIYAYIYDQSTLSLINTTNVTISAENGAEYLNVTTSTGTYAFKNLTIGNWTLTFSASGYAPSAYYVQVGNRSTQTLNAYLAQNVVSVIFTNKDSLTGDAISGGTFTIQNKVGPNWVTVGQVTTDAFGQAVFQLLPLHDYQFIISADGYFTKTGIVNTVITTYTVLVNANNTQSFTSYAEDFTFKALPNTVTTNLTSFSMTTSSPQGSLEWFAVVVTYNGTAYSQNVTGSPSGGTANVTIDFTNLTGAASISANYYAKSINIDSPMVIARSWYVYGGFGRTNYTFMDFVDYYGSEDSPIDMTTRSIIVTIVAVLIAAGAGLLIGAAGAMVGAMTVFIVAGIFGWIGVGVAVVVIGALVGLLLLGGRA